MPDMSADHCTKCFKDFSFFFRKHHCRICGNVFCKNCSQKKMLEIEGDTKYVRVCNKCDQMNREFKNNLKKN